MRILDLVYVAVCAAALVQEHYKHGFDRFMSMTSGMLIGAFLFLSVKRLLTVEPMK